MKDETYFLHQTPKSVALKIIENMDWDDGEKVCEPFKGEGAFYNQLPDYVNKSFGEIEEGVDFRSIDYTNIDTVITNPPFRLDNGDGRKNAFFDILMFFAKTNVKRIIFLCNDICFGSLTPKRLKELKENNLYIHSLTTCNVKKWRGRYRIITFKREPNIFFNYFLENFE